jgi:hypothetical protein
MSHWGMMHQEESKAKSSVSSNHFKQNMRAWEGGKPRKNRVP